MPAVGATTVYSKSSRSNDCLAVVATIACSRSSDYLAVGATMSNDYLAVGATTVWQEE